MERQKLGDCQVFHTKLAEKLYIPIANATTFQWIEPPNWPLFSDLLGLHRLSASSPFNQSKAWRFDDLCDTQISVFYLVIKNNQNTKYGGVKCITCLPRLFFDGSLIPLSWLFLTLEACDFSSSACLGALAVYR